jgi:peptidoglycan/LPS O-acetylase OafA/YrhL
MHWRQRLGGRATRSLEAAFDPRHNSLNALRLVFATAVIVSHAWPLGGFGNDPAFGGLTVGEWAVGGFFVISGYLITGSRLHNSLGAFMWRRFLRIFPGLWACLLVTVVVFVSVASVHEGGGLTSQLGSRVSYAVNNGLLLPDITYRNWGVGGTLANVPYPAAWNGSLWTLLYELGCYLVVAILLTFAALRKRPETLAFAFVFVATLHFLGTEFSPLPWQRIALALNLGTYFLAGALLYAYRERIPLRSSLAALATAVLVVASATGHASAVAALPLAYLCLWLGVVLPLRRVGRTNDLSYGVYIYAFPVAQLLVVFGAPGLGVWRFVLLSVALTFPLAAASWFVVERPAMRLKNSGFPLRRTPLPAESSAHVSPAHGRRG